MSLRLGEALPAPAAAVSRTDALERPLADVHVDPAGTAALDLTPFQLVTLKVSTTAVDGAGGH
jgi:hypothetical protein